MKKLIAVIVFAGSIYSCNHKYESQEEHEFTSNFVELPADLSDVDDSIFMHLDEWLGGAEIIGLSEGEHGMNEGMDFRNSYIRYLVKTNQVQVLAFESGLIESRMVNDYINGKNIDIDTVLTNGFSYTFGQFPQNRELIEWLRKTNESRDMKARVRFYGFDMAGNAPNPYLENSSYSLQECLNYVKDVDQEYGNKLLVEVANFIPYLYAVDNPKNSGVSFVDLSENERTRYLTFLESLIAAIEENESKYVQKVGEENYQWGLQMAKCARQNFIFLIGYHQPLSDHSAREKFMLENLKWIRKREAGRKILLFAHLSHLSKDISRIDEEGNHTIPQTMFGEHAHAEFGAKYKVIGNMFSALDYYDAIDSVKINSLPELIYSNYNVPDFCLRIDKADSIYSKRQVYGIPFKGDLWMIPSMGVDVIFYTRKQHLFTKE